MNPEEKLREVIGNAEAGIGKRSSECGETVVEAYKAGAIQNMESALYIIAELLTEVLQTVSGEGKLEWNKTEKAKECDPTDCAYDRLIEFLKKLEGEDLLYLASDALPLCEPKTIELGKWIVENGLILDKQHGSGYIHIDLVMWNEVVVVVDQSTETFIHIAAKDREKFEKHVKEDFEV